MGDYMDEFRCVVARCLPDTMQEILPVMLNVLTVPNRRATEVEHLSNTPSNDSVNPVTLDAVVAAISGFVDQGLHEGFIIMSLLSLIDDTLKRLSDRPEGERQKKIIEGALKDMVVHSTTDDDQKFISLLETTVENFDERINDVQSAYDDWLANVSPYLLKLRMGAWFNHAGCSIG
jgi:hypothetical protein